MKEPARSNTVKITVNKPHTLIASRRYLILKYEEIRVIQTLEKSQMKSRDQNKDNKVFWRKQK